MPDKYAYMDAIVAARSIRLSQEEATTTASRTLSAETQGDLAEVGLLTYIADHFSEFLRYLRYLDLRDQEILLCYHLLGVPQIPIGRMEGMTQTQASTHIRLILGALGCYARHGRPTAEVMHPIFVAAGVEDLLDYPLSEVIELYAATRSYGETADVLDLDRAKVRRVFAAVSKDLRGSPKLDACVLGAMAV